MRHLQSARALRRLGLDPRAICLGAVARRSVLATLHARALGLHRSRLDLGLQRAVRLGHLSLWPLGLLQPRRLVLGPRQSLGAGMGLLAPVGWLPRLGADAASL